MGINEELSQIKEMLAETREKDKVKKEKKFKLPFGKKVSKTQSRKNYVTIMKINENGSVDFIKEQINNQSLTVDGIPRLATADYVLRWKNNPLLIIPSWSVEPYSPAEQYRQSLNDGSNTKGYAILMERMASEKISQKKQMGNMLKWILGVGLVAIIAYAFITGGGA